MSQLAPGRVDAAAPSLIDPRGPQFSAALTAVVLSVVLLTAPGPIATVLLGLQALAFAVAASLGVTRTPYAWLFRRLVRPRLGAPAHLEDAAPPQFAQAVGFAFAIVGLIGFLSGAPVIGLAATALALGAALLNAVFGFCLGCEIYLLALRAGIRPAGRPASRTTT